MELNEELGAISAIFGDVVEVLDSSSCNVRLESLVVNVVWGASTELPRITVSEQAFAVLVESEMRSANPGDAIVFDLLEKLREAEKKLIEQKDMVENVSVEAVKHPQKPKEKQQKKNTNQKQGKDKRSGGGGGSGGRGGDGQGGMAGGGRGGQSKGGQGSKSQQDKPVHQTKPKKSSSVGYVPGAIFTGEQENRLAALLRLDEAEMPSSSKPMDSIVSGSSDARTKTRLLKCYNKLEAAGWFAKGNV